MKLREAIFEDEEIDPDFVWAIVEPADAVAIKKEMIDAGDASDVEGLDLRCGSSTSLPRESTWTSPSTRRRASCHR